MDIPRLTKDQIAEYMQVNAFALPRTDSLANARTSTALRTTSIQQSLGLLSKVQEKLTTIESNLELMHTLATLAKNPGRLSDSRRQEVYGQLRALSAGIDVIASDFELDGRKLLKGQKFELDSGNGTVRLDLNSVAASGEDSLNIATKHDAAFTEISYDYLAQLRNTSSDLIGLDLSEATPAEIASDQQELETGDYRIKITYKGPESIVDIQTMDGVSVRKVDGVDLSGNGQEIIDMGVGVKFSFEKTLFETVLGGDKYDYDLFGPTSLYANLKYERNEQHELFSGEELEYNRQDSVSIISGGKVKGTTGTLDITASAAGVQEGHTAMTSGQYRVQVRYDGDRSSVWLYDPLGQLISTKRGIDLTGNEALSIDMETGLRLKLDPEDFSTDRKSSNVFINYEAADQPDEIFDYKAYAKQIEKAYTSIEEQLALVASAQEDLTQRYQLANQATQAASAGAWVTQAQSLSSLLAGSLDSSILGTINGQTASSASDQLLLTTGDIFGSLQSAISTQANVDPTILAAM